ncbi:preprotein translocase, SecA subunit [Syntrophotalea carbinolica DSM 2380]|uniref:Protein translocase subunit SecA n=1 Tax=Syntrophotalea carbinolica (strain DSM 2380 / NBRC 103641 / GraBd1) TaxID=338963 RepID=SECA_SYNC1|nr:preprotein translocase subunit SecA [Syntrophotalea carbinolica]Q3A245.1 RecName: Full=Protein translocase subunit SecA [Syntrophotalea carbinolica DSM 2380]ABA89562.1 preprotein translocase, SecA subunit [Syntrophotalea carbinolica DSM 2380]
MFENILTKIFGSKNERDLKRLQPLVAHIGSLESELETLSEEQLAGKTVEFRQRLAEGASLDSLLPEAFAVVREAGKRVLGMRHFDVQLIGGMVLHKGKIAEMKTGEGKTLVATLAAYLNALPAKGVHVITVNDYLASRDAEWMGRIHRYLGLTVGCIVHGLDDRQRKEAYACDITYGTNNEFGFDYLRDNMKFSLDDYVQRPLSYAIVDEVDSILIDEARTPLIISGPSESSSELYYSVNRIIPMLEKGETIESRDGRVGQTVREYTGDFTIDEKAKTASLTEDGVAKVERLLGVENLYDPGNIELLHHVNQALKAHALFKRDVDYVVKDGEVMIVDEFTGRLMPGRRWSDGLHQAVEAKEGVKIESENQTLATITFQNYFRMYDKLAGMTGTADTEATEFNQIYSLDVMVIPTNRPLARKDEGDVIYKTNREKFLAVVEDIIERHAGGQPILVGTISIENSEVLSSMLRKRGVPHNVLNAKHHEREAEIVAQAGRKGAVTIATNMAGRGTDIILGGNPDLLAQRESAGAENPEAALAQALVKYQEVCAQEKQDVLAAGGLYILGTERHESRRIDNQLRGRAGRQGDPGASRFYLSLEDDLLRIFGSHRVAYIMDRLKIPEGEPIEHRFISKAIANAQKKVEAHNFDIRKHLIEYDDVMNTQRNVIYAQRREVLGGEQLPETFAAIIDEMVEDIVATFCPEKSAPEDWGWASLNEDFFSQFNMPPAPLEVPASDLTPTVMLEHLKQQVDARLQEREAEFTPPVMLHLMKVLLLQTIDAQWKDHLLSIDHLKEGIGLRGYAQRNPKEEYKREAYELFLQMMGRIRQEVVQKLFRIQLAKEQDVERMEQRQRRHRISLNRAGGEAEAAKPVVRDEKKVGRNDPCPCGSGLKYKKCCGQ